MSLKSIRGMTLVEVVVVIIIVGLLLTVTLYLGWDYLKTMKVKTDKEYFSAEYNQVMTVARTSNFHQGSEYEYIEVALTGGGLFAQTDSAVSVGSHYFVDGGLSFSGSMPIITVTPYSIGCSIDAGTGVDFSYVSSINDEVYCYSISDSTCKLLQIPCD